MKHILQHKVAVLLSVCSFACLLLLIGLGMALSQETQKLDDRFLIQFAAKQFYTNQPLPKIDKQLSIAAYPDTVVGYYLVQIKGPIVKGWKEEVTKVGAKIFSYIPNNAYIVKMDAKTKAKVEALAEVQWTGVYQPVFRLSPKLRAKLDTLKSATVIVRVFKGEDLGRISTEIRRHEGEILISTEGKYYSKLKVKIPPKKIYSIVKINGVEWIEEYLKPVLLPSIPVPEPNNVARKIMHVDPPEGWVYPRPINLTGNGQIVGICDSGLDNGQNDATMNDDFEGRIRNAYALGRTDDWSDDHGHGTHVAGSVVGSGANSTGNLFRGVAPEASLVFQSVLTWATGCYDYELEGIPLNLEDLFQPVYDNDSVRIHNNSWGIGNIIYSGIYTFGSAEVDQFVWDHPDMVICFGAGNFGGDYDDNGKIDSWGITPPSTAKNCISVGATESVRSSGGYQGTWGEYSSIRYPEDPIHSDHVSNDENGMAAFSSRGPLYDGRIKPDVVAPGTNIISSRSQDPAAVCDELWGEYDDYYSYCGGTSMACPLTAGTAALIRQYFTDIRGYSYVSTALVKATLINGAIDISPGQYDTGATQEIEEAPDGVQGWGRVSLRTSVPLHGRSIYAPGLMKEYRFVDETVGISTYEVKAYSFPIKASHLPFSVTLAYSDHPGVPSYPNVPLVNNIDMVVIDPSFEVHFPNNQESTDDINNIERVIIESPELGEYIVVVKGMNVPEGPQPFALAVSGIFSEPLEPHYPFFNDLSVDVTKFERMEMLLKEWPKYFELPPEAFPKPDRVRFEDFVLYVSAYNKTVVRRAIERAVTPPRILSTAKNQWILTLPNLKYTMSNLRTRMKRNRAFVYLDTELSYLRQRKMMKESYKENWELWKENGKWVLETYSTIRVK